MSHTTSHSETEPFISEPNAQAIVSQPNSQGTNTSIVGNISTIAVQRNQVSRVASRNRNPRSDVWDYLPKKRNEAGKVIMVCQHDMCGQVFSNNTSTTTLKDHLRRHGFFMPNCNQQRFQSDGSLTYQPPKPAPQRQLQSELALFRLLVVAVKPFSTVENEKFI